MEEKKVNWTWWKIGILCLVIVLVIAGVASLSLVFQNQGETKQEQEETYTEGTRISAYFPNPDRLVIKQANQNEYYIIEQGEEGYISLIQALDTAIDNAKTKTENNVTQDTLDTMEDSGCFLMLDYNRVSKNYILDRNSNELIRYKEDGGVIVRTEMDLDEITQKIEEALQGKRTYPLEGRTLTASSETVDSIPTENFSELDEKKNGIYQVKIESIEELEKWENAIGVSILEQTPPIDASMLEDHAIILTISNHPIESVTAKIRRMDYEFAYEVTLNYQVQFYLVSKAVNSDCIYTTIQASSNQQAINGLQADGTYHTNEYLDNYRIYSDYAISQEAANRLGFTKQENSVYTVAISNQQQLDEITKELKIYGFDPDGGSNLDEVLMQQYNLDSYQYLLCVKNTTGHFEAALKGSYDYVNGMDFDMQNLAIRIAELEDSSAKTKLQGNLIAIPKDVTYQTIEIQKLGGYESNFDYNQRTISVSEAKAKAKEILGTEDSQAFLDIASGQTPFGSYFLIPEDNLRRVWIVINDESTPSAVAIDATTGRILQSNELGC